VIEAFVKDKFDIRAQKPAMKKRSCMSSGISKTRSRPNVRADMIHFSSYKILPICSRSRVMNKKDYSRPQPRLS